MSRRYSVEGPLRIGPPECEEDEVHAKLRDPFLGVSERLRIMADYIEAESGSSGCGAVTNLSREAADLIDRLAREIERDEA